MLTNSQVAATIAVRDLDAGRQFYGDTLGLKVAQDLSPGAVIFEAGNGTMVLVYPRSDHVPSAATVASFQVADVVSEVASLKASGIKFEDYDMPGITTVNNIAEMPGGAKVAWFTDPDGNIISIAEM